MMMSWLAILTATSIVHAQTPTNEKACVPAAKHLSFPVQLRSGKKLEAKTLKPVFESLAKSLAQSPLSSLCDATPRFECWDQRGIPEGRLDFIELSKTRVLMRVACSMGAYNSSSYYVAFGIGNTSASTTNIARRGKSKASPGSAQPHLRGPALLLFPHHPGLLSGPHANWGLKPLEAIIGSRQFDEKSKSLFAYTKGLGNGTIGHFHQYSFAAKDGLPRLKISASKTLEDGKEEFHFDSAKSRFPPMTASWVRFKPKGELRGCLSGFDEFECSKITL